MHKLLTVNLLVLNFISLMRAVKKFIAGLLGVILLVLSVSCTTTGNSGAAKNIKTSPDDVNKSFEYITMAWEEYNRKNFSKALEYFDTAETLNPDEKQVFQGKIWVYNELNKPDKAKEYGSKLYTNLTENPVDPSYNYAYAADALAWGSRMLVEAVEIFSIQIKTSNDSYSLHNRGIIYKELGDLEKAKTDLLSAYQIGKKENNPDLANLERSLAEVSFILRDGMFGNLNNTFVALEPLYEEYLDLILVFKSGNKTIAKGNVGIDWNNDQNFQTSEIVPDAVFVKDDELFLKTELLQYFADNADKADSKLLTKLNTKMMLLNAADARNDKLGAIDLLGSVLSKKGLHPFESQRIYYFPNGSGDKVICDYINFYASTGSPMRLSVDVVTPAKYDDFSIFFSVPGVPGKVHAYLYDSIKVQESVLHNQKGDAKEYWLSKGLSPEYWSQLNTFTFHESGAMASYRGIPHIDDFPVLPLPDGITWRQDSETYAPMPNVAEWDQEGRLINAEELNGYYTFFNKITVHRIRTLRMINNQPHGRLYVQCYESNPATLTMSKGSYTFYRFENGKWSPYIKTFTDNTSFKVLGFLMDENGNITGYW